MRRIVIVRHAKSDWNDWSLADHDRPLAPRGVKALDRMRSHLTGADPVSLVLCSSARRTKDTLAGIRPVLPDDVDVRVEPGLYGAGAWSLIDRLRQLDDATTSVMIVGHNPGLHDLAVGLLGDPGAGRPDSSWDRLRTKFPTGAIATVTTAVPWGEIDAGCAELVDFFTPRPAR